MRKTITSGVFKYFKDIKGMTGLVKAYYKDRWTMDDIKKSVKAQLLESAGSNDLMYRFTDDETMYFMFVRVKKDSKKYVCLKNLDFVEIEGL